MKFIKLLTASLTVFALNIALYSFATADTKPQPMRSAPVKKFKRNYGTAGCGLGSQVFHEDGMVQILAATTNGTSGNQTFGITSGTSNCLDGASDHMAMQIDQYIDGNRSALLTDMTRGSGETLNALAHMMGCASSSDLGKTLQIRFNEIVPANQTNTRDITDSVITVIQNDESLSKSCHAVANLS